MRTQRSWEWKRNKRASSEYMRDVVFTAISGQDCSLHGLSLLTSFLFGFEVSSVVVIFTLGSMHIIRNNEGNGWVRMLITKEFWGWLDISKNGIT